MEEENVVVDIDPIYKGNIWFTPMERKDWRLYLTELSDDPKNHLAALDMLRTADDQDVIEILITCPGGRVDIADMYLAAISDSRAKIITRAIGECASAATTIFLAGDERVCDNGCYFMFHNVQLGGMGGDSANVFSRTKFYDRLFKEKFYGPMSEVLTAVELSELFDRAGEVYLTGEEMEERLKSSRREQIVQAFGEDLLPLPPGTPLVKLPFPETKVKDAVEFPQGDEFKITLDDGYEKEFRLSTLSPRDFDEYNLQEIREIAVAFRINLQETIRERAVDEIIDELLNGNLEGED